MSQPFCYYWPPTIVAGVSNTLGTYTLLTAAEGNFLGTQGNLVCNVPHQPGAFAYANIINPKLTTPGITTNIIRSIEITGAADTGGTNFTISGIGSPVDVNGNPTQIVAPITEQITGATDVLTVVSQNVYTVINSITVDRDTSQASIGYGPNGITNYYINDLNRNVVQGFGSTYSQYFVNNDTNQSVAVFVSLNYPESSNGTQSFDGIVNPNPPPPDYLVLPNGLFPYGIVNGVNITLSENPPMTSALIPGYEVQGQLNDNAIATLQTGYSTIWANVTETSTDHLFFTIIQQGI
ncbi:MAG TPA: hypothetical protein VNZ45_09685 [Bacteroidia bacterium]|jgi:hypothetical protein|nr:hypothetical protein [Bacteroidia bacterium]